MRDLSKSRKKTTKFGIVGGLGARAGADILNQIVKFTPIKDEGDHLEISFEQKPLIEPSGSAEVDYNPAHRKFYVFDTLRRMEESGCDAALLPCFITHTFLDELRPELNMKLISMTDAIQSYVADHHSDAKKIGVLTTGYVKGKGLFTDMFGPGVSMIYPTEAAQAEFADAIYGTEGFKSGSWGASVSESLLHVCLDLKKQGCDLIVPGMTEVPLILPYFAAGIDTPILNTNEIYARYALAQTSDRNLKPFKVGVVGGVGPAATIDFMDKLVSSTDANRDQDHIKILVEHNPQIPDRTSNLIGDGPDPTLAIYSTCKKLEQGGADIVAIPCNTAHAYVDRIQRHLTVPIMNILTETVDYIRKTFPEVKRVGILATTGTIKSGLYQEALETAGLEPITPKDAFQAKVMDAIYGEKGVKAGYSDGLCKVQLLEAFEHLEQNGTEVIILGCTELPLIAPDLNDPTRSVALDPTDILARKCVEIAGYFSAGAK